MDTDGEAGIPPQTAERDGTSVHAPSVLICVNLWFILRSIHVPRSRKNQRCIPEQEQFHALPPAIGAACRHDRRARLGRATVAEMDQRQAAWPYANGGQSAA